MVLSLCSVLVRLHLECCVWFEALQNKTDIDKLNQVEQMMNLTAFFSYLMDAYTEDSTRLSPVHRWCTAKRWEAIDTSCSKRDSNYTYISIYVYKLFTVRVVRHWTRCQGRLWNLLPWRFPSKTQLDKTWATPPNFEVSPAFSAEDWTRWAPEFPSSLNYAVTFSKLFSKITFFWNAFQTLMKPTVSTHLF